jgi:hypothetical protein
MCFFIGLLARLSADCGFGGFVLLLRSSLFGEQFGFRCVTLLIRIVVDERIGGAIVGDLSDQGCLNLSQFASGQAVVAECSGAAWESNAVIRHVWRTTVSFGGRKDKRGR